MALIIVSLFVLAPLALLLLDFSGHGPKRAAEPVVPLAPSYSELLAETGRYGSRTAPNWNEARAAV